MKCLVVGREGSRYENLSKSSCYSSDLTLFFCSWTPWPPLQPPCLPPPYHEIHREKWCIDASRRGVTSRFLPIAVPYLHLPSALKVKEIKQAEMALHWKYRGLGKMIWDTHSRLESRGEDRSKKCTKMHNFYPKLFIVGKIFSSSHYGASRITFQRIRFKILWNLCQILF